MTPEPPPRSAARIALHDVRARFCKILGVPPESRPQIVRGMLERHGRDSGAYWLQLLMSVGIATFGLIADSTGVVIGAMLVSPLMGPIMSLGMGLTTGSAILVLRAFARFTASVAVVVAGAALLQTLVPFDAITREIAARTSPTLLDLFVAVACALAGAFAAIRQGLDTATAAAGVAIGIALVPPICVVGIGIAMGNGAVAGGAALLFVANFVSIIAVSGLLFLLLGFDEVNVRELEAQTLGGGKRVSRLVEAIWRFFGTRSGIILRIAMPLAFVAAAAVPLSQALGAVAWQVRTRNQVDALVRRETASLATVQSQLVVERGHVLVRLMVVGSSATAAALRASIESKLLPEVRAVTSLDVVAVPDADALAAIALRTETVAEPPRATVLPSPPSAARAGDDLAQALAAAWPSHAGAITRWTAAWSAEPGVTLAVTHGGEPLGVAGELVERALTASVGVPVHLVETTPTPTRRAPLAAGLGWLPALGEALAFVAREPQWSACVTLPAAPAASAAELSARDQTLVAAARAMIAQATGTIGLALGDDWRVAVSRVPCPVTPEPAPAPEPVPEPAPAPAPEPAPAPAPEPAPAPAPEPAPAPAPGP